jgi:ribosome-binding protein aMBF1 (putative translation factor)
MKVTEQLRRAIVNSPKSRNQLSKKTGIDPAVLHRFVHGQRGLSQDSIDKLAAVLGLELKAKRPTRKRKKGKR